MLLGALLQYLTAAILLTAVVVAIAGLTGLVHLHATVLPQVVAYLALGGAMFVALLLQAFGSRIFPLHRLRSGAGPRGRLAQPGGMGTARGVRGAPRGAGWLRGSGAGKSVAACLIRRLAEPGEPNVNVSSGGEVSMTDQVAVTGAEGFIGSHLVEALVRQGHRVRAMVLYNMYSSRGWLDSLEADILDQVEVVFGDVRDPASVRELVEDAAVVYHLAALGSVPYSYSAPRSFVDTNVIGTLHVLEAVRACRTPRLVHTSTSETYGTARTVPISEAHVLQAQSPYAASKIAADKLVESYYLSFGTPVVTLRPFNTFGPRQSARAVIPAIIIQLAAGSRQLKLGALDPTRDFSYVTDTAQAFVELGEAPASAVLGELFNVGPGSDVSIGQLAEDIAGLMGVEADIVEDSQRLRPKDSEVMRLVCDASKLRDRTGWQPQVSRDAGLRRTIDWFLEPGNLTQYHPHEYNQ